MRPRTRTAAGVTVTDADITDSDLLAGDDHAVLIDKDALKRAIRDVDGLAEITNRGLADRNELHARQQPCRRL